MIVENYRKKSNKEVKKQFGWLNFQSLKITLAKFSYTKIMPPIHTSWISSNVILFLVMFCEWIEHIKWSRLNLNDIRYLTL